MISIKRLDTGRTWLACAGLAALCCLPCMAGTVLRTDAAKSSVAAVFRQMGVPVEGRFEKFNARIEFDAARPELSRANAEIDVASFNLGDAEFNKEALKKEWFDAARFPRAAFVSTAMTALGGDRFEVIGRLSIKGRTADVRFPMRLTRQGGVTIFEGSLPIRRLAFNIGEDAWSDTGLVADEIVIKFRIVTTT